MSKKMTVIVNINFAPYKFAEKIVSFYDGGNFSDANNYISVIDIIFENKKFPTTQNYKIICRINNIASLDKKLSITEAYLKKYSYSYTLLKSKYVHFCSQYKKRNDVLFLKWKKFDIDAIKLHFSSLVQLMYKNYGSTRLKDLHLYKDFEIYFISEFLFLLYTNDYMNKKI